MKNRINKKFSELKRRKKKAFIAYLTAGYPSISATEKLVLELEKNGVDVIELGVPFSDPLADGPTIQMSSAAALKKGADLASIFKLIRRIRLKSQVPIVLMTYYNPVHNYGVKRFVKDAVSSGADGIIIPDLPPEEAGELINASRKKAFNTIFLLAPTSPASRIRLISGVSRGFIYYVSLTGVTGARKQLPPEVSAKIRSIKRIAKRPLCVGFGVSTPEQVKSVAKSADGVIVGSAIIKAIQRSLGRKDLASRVGKYVKGLADAV